MTLRRFENLCSPTVLFSSQDLNLSCIGCAVVLFTQS